MCFSNNRIQREFFRLLDNPCPICDAPPFYSFDALKDHVRKTHELFYCDLCTENLKIFSFERRCYTRQDLALHRRKGDPNNTSHRGHPLCKYCDCRFLDRDELFRHLRKEHYFCHFCDADGANQFYADYESLRDHFRSEHFLCEEGDCAQEQFTAVFRSDIDLKGHIALIHGKSLGKIANKQARTLEFEFTLAPRNRINVNGETSRGSMRIRNDPQMEFEIDDRMVQMPQKTIDHQNEAEFPSLGPGTSSSAAVTVMKPNMTIRAKAYGTTSNLARTKENFPALGGENSKPDPGPSLSGGYNIKNSASAILKNNSNSGSSKPAGMVIHVSNRPKSTPASTPQGPPNRSGNDFPALPGSHKSKLTEDFVEVQSPIAGLNAVSAKHKSLLSDTFVSVAPANSTKINLVKQENSQLSTSSPKKSAPPKLNSSDSFPALSAPSANNLTAQWPIQQSTKPKIEPKKSKVAPAPILTNTPRYPTTITSTTTNSNKPKVESKKEKKKENQKSNNPTNIPNSQKQNNKTATKENNNNNVQEISDRKSKNQTSDKIITNDEFPSLLKNKSNTNIANAPPGFGNDQTLAKTIAAPKPPPGFNKVTLNSVARPQNNLTFTTSLGESFNILPAHHYQAPPNASKRNQTLVTNFQQALSPSAIQQFRQASQMFRDGSLDSQVYYQHCQEALGEKFNEIFPELLALLPDITKQQVSIKFKFYYSLE